MLAEEGALSYCAVAELRYSPAHVWTRVDGDVAVLGLSDYLQDQLGEVVAIELPDVGDVLTAQRRMAGVRTEAGLTHLDAPLTGEVTEVNAEVLANPDLVNQDPYEGGWLVAVHVDDPAELDELLTEEEYADLTTEV